MSRVASTRPAPRLKSKVVSTMSFPMAFPALRLLRRDNARLERARLTDKVPTIRKERAKGGEAAKKKMRIIE